MVDQARENELVGRFTEALRELPWVAERIERGQQFNAYERASNGEDDDPEDLEFIVGIGPITGFASLFEVTGKAKAELVESALKLAALQLQKTPA